jgi:carbamoyl-phosphate synthase large subunit
MRSTGEVMGIASTFGEAYAKSQSASFGALPHTGRIFLSLSERDKASSVDSARALVNLGFELVTTKGTHAFLEGHGIYSRLVRKHSEGSTDGVSTCVDLINAGEIDLIINTPLGRGSKQDGWMIRTAAVARSVPCITTIAGFKAAVAGISERNGQPFSIRSIQEWLAIHE